MVFVGLEYVYKDEPRILVNLGFGYKLFSVPTFSKNMVWTFIFNSMIISRQIYKIHLFHPEKWLMTLDDLKHFLNTSAASCTFHHFCSQVCPQHLKA